VLTSQVDFFTDRTSQGNLIIATEITDAEVKRPVGRPTGRKRKPEDDSQVELDVL